MNRLARSNTGIVDSNPTRGIDVSMRLFRVCVVLCVSSGFATGSSPVQVVLPTMYKLKLNSVACSPQANYTDQAAAAC
jgi:hypothetical protein